MRFISIYLKNYIGIYNGMGLYEIHIDMTKCKNNIIIIRGDNGSGKSTLMKSLNVFPDPNDSFIPGLAAFKEIYLGDSESIYKLTFIHEVKQNGDRETTKAYISKAHGPEFVELNPNGNVSSYKDIIFNELGLDANFVALSQLSNDDRGLADKKPAERKRFVNSIINSLDVYNNIYKVLSKKSSNLKSMISSVASKLQMMGDTNNLKSQLDAIEIKINNAQKNKDYAISLLAEAQSRIKLLDPDGSIQNKYENLNNTHNNYLKEIDKYESLLDKIKNDYNLSDNYKSDYEKIINEEKQILIDNQIDRSSLDLFIDKKDNEAAELNRKVQQIQTLANGIDYDEYKSRCESYHKIILDIENEFKRFTGIDNILAMSREEYQLSIQTIHDIYEAYSIFKGQYSYDIQNEIITSIENNGTISYKDKMQLSNILSQKEKELESIRGSINDYNSRNDILNIIKQRPSNCNIDDCPFIKAALDFQNKYTADYINNLLDMEKSLSNEISQIKTNISNIEIFNNAVNDFNNIIRMHNMNSGILSKIPRISCYTSDIKKCVLALLTDNSELYNFIEDINKYIDICNLYDIYKKNKSIYDDMKKQLDLYESKFDIINSINEDIEKINKEISDLINKIEPLKSKIIERETRLTNLKNLESIYSNIFEIENKLNSYKSGDNDTLNNIAIIQNNMDEINKALSNVYSASANIETCTKEINPLITERDKLKHLISLVSDYNNEIQELQQKYEYIETIKYYSSPTTGIQLVFMELYMGKIISLANELLSLLFNGEYIIQPFIINESEFRIPCLGSGYLNDDISSMSSSQIGMISMILSFSLLYNSSTKYNIIKLDEIDGPLDYNNRVYFADVLNRIMSIMGTEQCIMISHNSELQLDNADIILLKHDTNNPDYNRGNIIWSY